MPFDPLSLSPALWLKADAGLYQDSAQTTLATADADPVGAWQDQSGNARHVTQATAGSRPTLKLSIQNGLSVVRFDGSDDYLVAGASVSFKQAVVVAKYSAATFAFYPGLITGANAIEADAVLVGQDSAAVFYDSSSQTTVYHADGLPLAESAMSGPMNDFSSMSISQAAGWSLTPQVGKDRAGARFWLGDIAEILLFTSVLADADRQDVEDYLNGRWFAPIFNANILTLGFGILGMGNYLLTLGYVVGEETSNPLVGIWHNVLRIHANRGRVKLK